MYMPEEWAINKLESKDTPENYAELKANTRKDLSLGKDPISE